MLTKKQKLKVIESHIEGLLISRYSAEILIIQEKAKANPSEDMILHRQEEISSIDLQIAALENEIKNL